MELKPDLGGPEQEVWQVPPKSGLGFWAELRTQFPMRSTAIIVETVSYSGPELLSLLKQLLWRCFPELLLQIIACLSHIIWLELYERYVQKSIYFSDRPKVVFI